MDLPDTGVVDQGGLDQGQDPGDAGSEQDVGALDQGLPLMPGQVQTSGGVVQGRAEGGLHVFLGVPYAAPPVGALRFRPPEPHPGWSGALEASAFGPVCPQLDRQGALTGEEDCLSLNIWADLSQSARPVMVWIHGGGFVQGASSVPFYDGARLVEEQEVVMVTINYRLGVLGFLATEQLIAESGEGTAGNYGLRDQLQALAWVRENIAAFGGDPEQVTIFGESAGGASVCGILGAPSAERFFARAIIESGGGCFSFPPIQGGRVSAVDIGEQLLGVTGCEGDPDPLACLRALSAGALVSAQAQVGSSGLGLPDLGPTIDGVLLPEQTLAAFRAGRARDVPILIGSNADEAVIFTQALPVPTRAEFERLVQLTFGAQLAPQVSALYPEAEFPDPKQAYNAAFSDLAFNCPAESFARIASAGSAPTFLYYFNHRLSGVAGAQGVLHGSEIPFVFGTLDMMPRYMSTPGDEQVSAAMRAAWGSFARGAPQLEPAWPAYSAGAESIMNFEAPPAVSAAYRGGRCEALQQLGVMP